MSFNLVSPVLVGRHVELAALHDAWARAQAGEQVNMLVAGESGLGKSRLVREFLDQVRGEGGLALAGRCTEMERGGIPFTPLVDMARTLGVYLTRDQLRDLLGPALPVLVGFIPEFAVFSAEVSEEKVKPERLVELLIGFLRRVGREGPVVLVFEDVHWADTSTIELLSHLLGQRDGGPLLVVLTARPELTSGDWPFQQIGEHWVQQHTVELLRLERLRMAEVAAQVEAIVGGVPDDDLVEAITERSDGRPVFVEELLSAGDGRQADAAGLAPSVRGAVLNRLQLLSDDAQLVVRSVSTAIRPMSETALLFVTGLDYAALAAALREAVANHLLTVDEALPGYRFRHALATEAIREDLSAGERIRLHAAHADAIELRRQARLTDLDTSMMLAHHWLAAEDYPRALRAAVSAASAAVTAGTPTVALRHLELAIELWDRVPDAEAIVELDHMDLLFEAADAAGWAGMSARGLELIDQAFAEFGDDISIERSAPLVVRRTQLLRDLGREEESLVVLKALVERLPDQPSATVALVLANYGGALVFVGRLEGLGELADRAAAIAEQTGPATVLLLARQLQATARMDDGDPEGALELMSRTAEHAREQGLVTTAVRSLMRLTDIQIQLARHEDALTTAEATIAYAQRVGLARTYGSVQRLNAGDALMRLGRWPEALARLDPHDAAPGVFVGGLLMQRADLRLLMGDLDGARDDLAQARHQLRAAVAAQFALSLARLEAELAFIGGDLRLAGEIVEQALGEVNPATGPRYRWPLVWIGLRIEADRIIRAREDRKPVDGSGLWLATLVGEVERLPVQAIEDEGHYALCRAEYARALGVDGAEWASAVVAVREMNNQYPLAYALFRSAEALIEAGMLGAAIAAAGEARKLAEALGAQLLLAQVEGLGVL